MTEYRLENGDKIEAQNYYRTKDGSKALVGKIYIVHGFATCLLGIIFTKDGQFRETAIWGADGKYHIHPDEEFNPEIYDLISLWPSESVTKCDQLGKVEITDDIMQVASTAFCNCKSLSPNEKKPIILYNYRMKAALEAVFTHIANNKEKPNSSIWDSFSPELPILDKQDNDGWIEWNSDAWRAKGNSYGECPIYKHLNVEVKDKNGDIHGADYAEFWNWVYGDIIAYRIISDPKEEKKEPKKQTLLEFIDNRFAWCIDKELGYNYQILKAISEYLEENN